jgi:DNA/RNA-binding domain of Phe-tRNA-synthetase-like protein
MLTVSETWSTIYPEAVVGILTMRDVINPDHHPALDARKAQLEHQLRSRFAGQNKAALKALPTIQAYTAYYKRFKKTYHLLLQLESVAIKGKPIPRVAGLVEAMFMAELTDLLLTAGHDLEAIHMPLRLDVSDGSERFTRINGQEQVLKPGDMFIADAQAVISSVIYGTDQRTRITPGTRQVFFSTYAPAGIGEQAVRQHLENIRSNIEIIAPESKVMALELFGAG